MAKAWDDSNYPYRWEVVVDYDDNTPGANATNPVALIVLTNTQAIEADELISKRYRIFDSTGTECDYDEDVYSGEQGVSYANFKTWVRIGTLYSSPSGDQNKVWVYHGYDPGTDQDNPAGVWQNFEFVLHLADLTDATGNHTPASAQAPTLAAAGGVVGDCYKWDSAGDYISIPDHADLDGMDDYYISCWVYHEGAVGIDSAANCRYVCKGDYDGAWAMTTGTDLEHWNSPDSYEDSTIDITAVLDQWLHLVIARRRNTVDGHRLYINGAENSSPDPKDASDAAIAANAADVYIGNNAAKDRTLDGWMDEVRMGRFSPGAANANVDDWVAFEYANITQADNEQTWAGARETQPTAGTLLMLQPNLMANIGHRMAGGMQ